MSGFNIARALPAMAASRPDKPAVAMPVGRKDGKPVFAHLTFAELDARSDAYAWGLASVGIGPGVRTVLMVKPSLDFFALVFALFKVGAVIVMIDPGIDKKALKACLAESEAEAFVGIPLAHVARLAFGKALASVRIPVTVGRRWFWGGHRLADLATPNGPYPMAGAHADEQAAILFTSGSTGVPKGAVYTHGVFDAQVRLIQQMYRFADDEIDLPTFPLFALFDPALGMTAVLPDMDFRNPGRADPRKIVEAIEAWGCTNMFGSPALLRNLGAYGRAHGARLPTLRRVLSAGAPVPHDVLRDMHGMLADDAAVHTPYGATECLPMATIDSRTVLSETVERTAQGDGICVGRPVDGMTVRVIRVDDGPIARWADDLLVPEGVIGEITGRGPVATASYWARPEQTALAKIDDAGAVVHRMGDLGWFDADGRLWMCGRKSHRVRAAGGDVYTIPVERVFDTHPLVERSALVGVGAPGAEVPVLLVIRRPDPATSDAALIAQLRAFADARTRTAVVQRFLLHPGPFPVDIRHNAKIRREDLRPWAEARLGGV